MSSIQNYFIHLRPRSWLIVGLHFAVGGIVGAGGLLFADILWLKLLTGAVIWAIFLNGGTLALNSAYDRDTEDIGYLDNPPPTPPNLNIFGITLMLIGAVLVVLLFNLTFFLIYMVCVMMSLLYSCPPVRLKARAGGDILINSLGYGALTFAGGYVSLIEDLSKIVLILAIAFAFLFAGFYPLTQIYQYRYDNRRGDATFTVWLTPRRALNFSIVAIILAFAFFFTGIISGGDSFFSYFLLSMCLALWLELLLRWRTNFNVFPHKSGMYHALYLWGLTDISIILIFSGM
ncbi:MAG: UbiA family prenyltransferase [Candidatus Sumerlaeia bacterium]|nr:UbiA family prenyltransferase [Candidatus Sumerlaeia bacterium]